MKMTKMARKITYDFRKVNGKGKVQKFLSGSAGHCHFNGGRYGRWVVGERSTTMRDGGPKEVLQAVTLGTKTQEDRIHALVLLQLFFIQLHNNIVFGAELVVLDLNINLSIVQRFNGACQVFCLLHRKFCECEFSVIIHASFIWTSIRV